LIRQGRARQIRNLLLEQASFAAAIALGGAILLLILGTQILNWYWLVILFAVSLAAGAYRGRNRILSNYQVAQSIDSRLGFHDALSTAFFFSEFPKRAVSPAEFIADQREAAESLARSADLQVALPFGVPKTFYINALLALTVLAMFGVRYGINRNLDLRSSLIHIGFDGFFSSREVADAKHNRQRPFDQDSRHESGVAVDPWESKETEQGPAPNAALDNVDEPEVSNPEGGADPSAKSKATGKDQTPPGDDLLNTPDKGQSSPSNNDKAGDDNGSPDGDSKSGKQDSAQKNSDQSSSSGENPSLGEKMRDAIANLMAKLKAQPKTSDGKQGGSSAQNGQQSAQKQNQNQQNSKGSSGEQQSESNANSQSQGDQQSQNGSQQSAAGKSEARNSDQTTQDGKSGIGKQDGDKTAREAEQLAAMGKISEIIGKRAANVSGEVMVEVASGKQQLKTQYSQKDAKHVEAGGEINRDEVPLAYQQYVQQYFEEIRKQPAAKAKADAKAKTSGN
jgi:hypothetical protein